MKMNSSIAQLYLRIVPLSLLFGCLLSPVPLFASEAESDCQIPVMGRTVEPVILRVALYPFVPDRVALFEKLESRFECDHPGVNVVLVSSPNATDDYYADDKSAHKGFQYVSADVYEIDTILLAEFIALGKIAPISLPYDDFPPEAIKAVSRDGKVFGVPHWLCGNFLFYRAGDVEVANARSWGDLSRILTSRNQDLLVDFKGRSTLGEWYFTVLSAIVGLDTAQQQIVDDSPVNMDAVGYLQNILEECPEGYCRSDALHNNTGFMPELLSTERQRCTPDIQKQ